VSEQLDGRFDQRVGGWTVGEMDGLVGGQNLL